MPNQSLLNAALARRGARALQSHQVCRLVAGAADGLDGLVIDRLGEFAFATTTHEQAVLGDGDLQAMVGALGLRGLSLRRRAKGGRGEEILALGEPLPERLLVQEGDLTAVLRIHPQSLSYGLFPDLRPERLAAAEQSRAKTVLNLYAYSGLFGVHAALAGATRVVQVDALKSTLAMIRANEEANEVRTVRICEDALLYCQRASRRGERFDLVIHDPPTFGRTPKGRARSLKSSLVELLAASISVVAKGGRLLSVVNTASMSKRVVAAHHQQAAQQAGCQLKLIRPLISADDAPSALKGGWYEVRSIR
jgi:23S rRNA (cytosine1962-C5)-methyltransferase